ncbi:MAG: hypothetical protein GWM98_30260, partial [Nitrospinaceae bacterium]|nr:hypothetical protein [Nitrospinaceae bacterium]NIR57752.1 hypothetical protein [Nitrospinaceae bacterium]NIS88212.1 hypothetical protein [Nitrospinaceae bacterium]NIT85305.1 hypothetical protein [Nitrospinaceae bacterium]NIU47251.1 hypothetical protein [Nitrospinaceae bacterium]
GRLVAADSDPHAPALRQVDHARVVPPFSDPACRDAVLNLCRDHAIQTIVPLTNKAVEFLDAHREILHPCGLGPFLPDSALIDTC